MDTRRTLIVYREELLGPSETFIRAQAESLQRFSAFYFGLRRIPGLPLPDLRFHILSGTGWVGRLRRARFKLLGPSADLERTLASTEPALIHAHFGPDACNAMALARALDIPLIVTFHGYDATVSNQYLPALYVRRQNDLKRFAAKVLCVSNFIRDRVIEKGFPPKKTIVHYTGVDTDLFRPDRTVSRLPFVLFVGRLVAKKGCEYLIRAMSRVQEALPDVQLVVIGEGPLRPELERQAATALKSYQFLGAQNPTVVRNWMNRAMVFCAPSLTAPTGDAEGFGMVFAEAQAMGLPIVSFASGGIPEAVADGQTGFLVRERDWKALADRLLILLSDEELWLRFSDAGQIRIRTRFDVWKQASVLESIYDSVLAERACTPLHARAVTQDQVASATRQSVAVSSK
jgi:colanic acid/amylovoran biosynthesis glycosyltransferase